MKNLFLTRPRMQIIFNNLRIWRDLNQNGISEDGELKTLTETGIKEISLAETLIGADSIVKYITKRLSFFTFLIAAFFYTQFANASPFSFTRITCIPELNYFDASVIEIDSGSNKETDFIMNNGKELEQKYQLMNGEISICKLANSLIKAEIKYPSYDETFGRLFCRAAPPAIFRLWLDGKLIVHLRNFNDCLAGGDYSVKSVSVKIDEEEEDVIIGFDIEDNSDRPNLNIGSYTSYKKTSGLRINKKKENFLPINESYITQYLINKTK